MNGSLEKYLSEFYFSDSDKTILATEGLHKSTKEPFSWDHAILMPNNVFDRDIPQWFAPSGVYFEARQVLLRPTLLKVPDQVLTVVPMTEE